MTTPRPVQSIRSVDWPSNMPRMSRSNSLANARRTLRRSATSPSSLTPDRSTTSPVGDTNSPTTSLSVGRDSHVGVNASIAHEIPASSVEQQPMCVYPGDRIASMRSGAPPRIGIGQRPTQVIISHPVNASPQTPGGIDRCSPAKYGGCKSSMPANRIARK